MKMSEDKKERKFEIKDFKYDDTPIIKVGKRFYRLNEEDKDTVFGSFNLIDDMIHPISHQWKWLKIDGVKCGVEVLSAKEAKTQENFFKVMKEITAEEFNHLWGLNLQRL